MSIRGYLGSGGCLAGGGGRVHCAFALCAAPGLRQVGVAQGEEGGGTGANKLQVGVQSALRCAGLCWLGRCRGGGAFLPLWLIRGFAFRGCQHRRRQGRGGNVLWRVPGGMASGGTEFTQGIKIIVSGYWWANGPGWVVVQKFVGVLDEWRERPIAFNQGLVKVLSMHSGVLA